MKRILLMLLFALTACTQEIPADIPTEFPTFAYPSPSPAQPAIEFTQTLQPTLAAEQTLPGPAPTPTPVVFPPPAPLPNVALSLIAIGDGLTFGEGDDTFRGYPGRLLELVVQTRPDSTLANFGQSGWSSGAVIRGAAGLPGQLSRAVAETQAAVAQGRGVAALVWLGSQDLWDLYNSSASVDSALEERNLQTFTDHLDLILYELRSAGAEVLLALLDDQSKRPGAASGGAFPGITPEELQRMSVQVQRYNAVILQKAEQYGVLVVDFYSTDIFANPANLAADGVHPNRRGYDRIAQQWYEVLSLLFD